jgi:hypothetical protein
MMAVMYSCCEFEIERDLRFVQWRMHQQTCRALNLKIKIIIK